MKKLSQYLISVFMVLSLYSACKMRTNSGEVLHNSSDGVAPFGRTGAYWIRDLDLGKLSSGLFGNGPKAPVVDTSSPMAQRLQFWVTQIDKALRLKFGDQMQGIPSPKAILVPFPDKNAFALSAPVCFNAQLYSSTLSADSSPTVTVFPYGNAPFITINKDECALFLDDLSLLQQSINAYNAEAIEGQSACKLFLNNRVITYSGKCNIDHNSQYFAIRFQTPYFFVLSGLLKGLSEEAVVGVIAHELGHFYQAHSMRRAAISNFFYSRDSFNQPGKPLRVWDQSMQTAFEALLTAAKDSYFEPVFSSPNKLVNLYDLANNIVLHGGYYCPSDCSSAVKEFQTQEKPLDSIIYGAPEVDALRSQEQKAALLRVEQMVLDFFNKIPFPPKENFAINGVVSAVRPFSMRNSIPNTDILPLIINKTINTYGDLLRYISSRVISLVPNLSAELNRLGNQGFGFYTQEEEADDLSAEYLSLINLDPKKLADAMISFGADDQASGKAQDLFKIPMSKCLELRNQHWMQNAQPIRVIFGASYEVHHSNCYRIFNIDQEINRHNWTFDPSKNQHPSGDDWNTLVQKTLAAEVPATSGETSATLPQALLGQPALVQQARVRMRTLCSQGFIQHCPLVSP